MNSDFLQLKALIDKTAQQLEDTEQYFTEALALRAKKLAYQYPTDTTAVGMVGALEKKALQSPMITRGELKNIYDYLFTPGNMVKGVFAEELGLKPEKVIETTVKRNEDGTEEKIVEKTLLSMYDGADQHLVAALETIWDKNATGYSKELAKNAANTCLYQLECLSAKAPVKVVAGQADVLICQATYQTPKGEVSILIPVEVKNSQTLLPNMFLTREGFVDLTRANINNFVKDNAGRNFRVNPEQLLAAVAELKNGVAEPLSEVEMIVLRAKHAAEPKLSGQYIYGEMEKEVKPLEMPKYAAHPEVIKAADKLTPKMGEAQLLFGKTAVEQGMNYLVVSLRKMGYLPQVSITEVGESSITFAVAVNHNTGFKVPVKVANKKIQLPTVVISAGGMAEFTKAGIDSILTPSSHIVALASSLHEESSSQLLGVLKQAMTNNDYLKAEEVLNVLQHGEDQIAFRNAFDIYSQGLRGEVKQASQCNRQIKTANSVHMTCAHLNLPVHKVYQDSHGSCRPLYRQNQDLTSEAVKFVSTKILMG